MPISSLRKTVNDHNYSIQELKERIIGIFESGELNQSNLHLFIQDQEMEDSKKLSDYMESINRRSETQLNLVPLPMEKIDHVDIREGDPEDFEEKITNVVALFPEKPKARIEELLRRYEYDEYRVLNMLVSESSDYRLGCPPRIELTQEDQAVIQMLMIRFPNLPEREIIETYISCDKNEENTLSILNIS